MLQHRIAIISNFRTFSTTLGNAVGVIYRPPDHIKFKCPKEKEKNVSNTSI